MSLASYNIILKIWNLNFEKCKVCEQLGHSLGPLLPSTPEQPSRATCSPCPPASSRREIIALFRATRAKLGFQNQTRTCSLSTRFLSRMFPIKCHRDPTVAMPASSEPNITRLGNLVTAAPAISSRRARPRQITFSSSTMTSGALMGSQRPD